MQFKPERKRDSEQREWDWHGAPLRTKAMPAKVKPLLKVDHDCINMQCLFVPRGVGVKSFMV